MGLGDEELAPGLPGLMTKLLLLLHITYINNYC